jgi:hypothetical protein
MAFTGLSVKWHKDLNVPAQMCLIYDALCAGEVPGFRAGTYAVKPGGCLGRRIDERPNDPLQYPGELFKTTIIQVVSNLPDAATGAMAEQAAIGACGVHAVNTRRKVSKSEHKGADTEPLGSTVYVKVVHLHVATSKDAFDSAWDQHKASNPHKYACTLMQQGLDKKSLGIDKKSLGIDKQSLGIDKKSLGIDKQSQGIDKQSQGLDKQSQGLDKQSLGLDKQSLGLDKKSLGLDKKSLGTGKAKGPAVGAKYQKSTLPHGNPPALLEMFRKSFSDEQLRVVFNKKSAGTFSSDFSSSRAPTSLHQLCNQESSPAAFKGFRCNASRFKGLQQLYNDQSK